MQGTPEVYTAWMPLIDQYRIDLVLNGAGLRQRWLDSIYRHAQFICGNFSLYSSANNHLLGEATGLFIASNTW